MNTFINQLTEEVLNEAFDIKSIATAFFKKHPGLLKQVKDKCGDKFFNPDIKLNKADYNIVKELYINNDADKAKQLIKGLYKPQDKKYSYLMSMMSVNEAVSKKLLGLAFMLALSSGLLAGCDMMMMDTMESHIETVIDQELHGDFVHTYRSGSQEVHERWIFDGTNKSTYTTDREGARYPREIREIEIESGNKIRYRRWSDDPMKSHGWTDWGTYSFYEKDGVTNISIEISNHSFNSQPAEQNFFQAKSSVRPDGWNYMFNITASAEEGGFNWPDGNGNLMSNIEYSEKYSAVINIGVWYDKDDNTEYTSFDEWLVYIETKNVLYVIGNETDNGQPIDNSWDLYEKIENATRQDMIDIIEKYGIKGSRTANHLQ